MGHPPQGHVEDNGEGQENHGGATANLGNSHEGLHGGLVQDRPLWATPPNRTHQLEVRPTDPQRPWPLPGSPLPGQECGPLQKCWVCVWRGGDCYQQQGKEGQMVTAADSCLGSRLCGTALGRPVSCGPWRGGERTIGEGREGRRKRRGQRGGEGP